LLAQPFARPAGQLGAVRVRGHRAQYRAPAGGRKFALCQFLGESQSMDLRTVQIAEVRQLLVRHLWKPALWGDLSGMTVPELLNVFRLGRRTGLLLVRSPQEERALGFREGAAVLGHSTCSMESDLREICYGLLKEQAGSFVFLRGPGYALPAEEGVDIEEILLDGMRRLDEDSWPPVVEAA